MFDIFNKKKLKKLEEANEEKTKLIIKMSREKVWHENIIGALLGDNKLEIKCDGSRSYYVDYIPSGKDTRIYKAMKIGDDINEL